MTEQDPTPTQDPKPTPQPPSSETQPAAPKGDDEGKGGKDAILADLSRERDKRQQLEQQMTELQNAQKAQTDALAKAFGLKEGEKPEADKLAEQVGTLQARIDAAERKSRLLELASEHAIPTNYMHLLTGADDETLKAQAEAVAELVKGKTPGTPAPDPTQGAQPTSPEAAADAEYERFYPSPTPR